MWTRVGTVIALGLASLVAFSLLPIEVEAQARARRPRRVEVQEEGRLIILCQQQGARVFIDEREVGTIPIEPQHLPDGSHTVRVSSPGFTEFSEVVAIRRGQDSTVEVELMAISTVVSVRTEPLGAQVFVDGRFAGETPLEIELVEGDHALRIRHIGFHEVLRSVRAEPGRTLELDLRLVALPIDQDPTRMPREGEWYEKPLPWIAIGGGAVLVALGVVLAVSLSEDDPSALQGFCARPGGCIQIDP